MTAKNLSTVATDIVETYGKTAINAITTSRVATERLLGFVDRRVAAPAVSGTLRLSEGLRSNVVGARQRARSLYLQGLANGATRAHDLVTAAVRVTSEGIERFAAFAERAGAGTASGSMGVLTRAALPAANVLSNVSRRVQDGSDRLVRFVAEESGTIDRPVAVRGGPARTTVVAAKRKVGAKSSTKQGRAAKTAKRSLKRAR